LKRELLSDKERVLYEDNIGVAVLPKNAATKGHIIILPKKEVRHIEELTEDELEHLFYLASYSATALFEGLGAHGTNIITTEGEEFYIEVISRTQEDGLNFQWTPKKLSGPDLDGVTGSISNSIIIPSEEEKPDNPPRMEEQPENVLKDGEEDYQIKQLERIP